MKKTVNFCGNCPFFVSEYDDFAIRNPFTNTCNLSKFQRNDDEYFLPNENEILSSDQTPEWCPLKKEEFLFEFKEFSPKRISDIDSVKNEIIELEKMFDNLDGADFSDQVFLEYSEKLKKLYTILGSLQTEELTIEQVVFNEDLNNQIEEIKKQLYSIEDAGNKLQESIFNLGKL